jgi:glutaminase
VLPKLTEVAIELIVSVFANGTGVEDYDVGQAIFDWNVACALEQARQALRVVDVHLATEGANFIAALGSCSHNYSILRLG